MDEYLSLQSRQLDSELSIICTLTNEIATLSESCSDLEISVAAQKIPCILNLAREAEAFVKEVEMELSSHFNSFSAFHESSDVKIERSENGERRSDDVFTEDGGGCEKTD